MPGIEVDSLVKAYGDAEVLRGISFSVPAGSVTGLLGPNGAGKTTLLRMMVGLGRPDAGRTRFDGRTYAELPQPTAVVGCLLDASAHHPGRTVRETVTLQALYTGLDASAALDQLETVGLSSVLKRRFGALSLGMRQRVGLAIALLNNPSHLLLDEPMNGLDIETMAWVRDRIVKFAREDGGCVLISSHLLQELQSFADRIVVMSQGSLVFEGDMAETRGQRTCVVSTPEPAALTAALRAAQIAHTEPDASGRLTAQASAAVVGRLAHRHHLLIEELVPGEPRALEAFYLSLTQGDFQAQGGLRVSE